jgi:hypothetical protein
MKPLPEELNDVLERQRMAQLRGERQPGLPRISSPEVATLARLARDLQSAPALQADPSFVHQLERRMLAHKAALQRQRQRSVSPWWGWLFSQPARVHPAWRAALSLCIIVIMLGTGVLVAAAQVTNPDNPFYVIKQWEQQARVSLSGSPADQAELDLQLARDRLNSLPGLADAAHAGEYQHALSELDQQLQTAAQAINALSAGPDHTRLAGELASLQQDARHVLRGLLLQLALPERLATTNELGLLGEPVPHLAQVEITLSARPNEQATVKISGDHFQPGAQLLVDGKPVVASGVLQDGGYLFTTDWNGAQHPHTIGIVNPDGTAAQTTAITIVYPTPGNGSGNGQGGGNGNGHGGGNGDSKPTP